MTLSERALRYVLAMPPSLAGQGGHDACFAAACALTHGFGLGENEAMSVLRAWNSQRAQPPWNERELAHKIKSALAAPSRQQRGHLLKGSHGQRATPAPTEGEGVAPQPQPPTAPRLPGYDPEKLRAFAAGCGRTISEDWLRERSPVALPPEENLAVTQQTFLEAVFQPGETVLIFTTPYSQGDFAWTVGGGGARLGGRGTAAVPSSLPTAGREGVWFLSNPVSCGWHIAPGGREGEPKWSRRSEGAVTAWRHLVIESDEAPPALWLRALVLLPVPLVAIYTSGGRSIHALARIAAREKGEMDAARDVLRAALCPLGCDGRALTAVRLSRLPGALRRGSRDAEGRYQPYPQPRRQRLLWLNRNPDETPIFDFTR